MEDSDTWGAAQTNIATALEKCKYHKVGPEDFHALTQRHIILQVLLLKTLQAILLQVKQAPVRPEI